MLRGHVSPRTGQYAEKWDDNSVAVRIGRSSWYFAAIGARKYALVTLSILHNSIDSLSHNYYGTIEAELCFLNEISAETWGISSNKIVVKS